MATKKGKSTTKPKEGETKVTFPRHFDLMTIECETVEKGKSYKWEIPATRLLDYAWLTRPRD